MPSMARMVLLNTLNDDDPGVVPLFCARLSAATSYFGFRECCRWQHAIIGKRVGNNGRGYQLDITPQPRKWSRVLSRFCWVEYIQVGAGNEFET